MDSPDRCAAVTAAWRTYDFHQSDPVSNMWQQFNNDTCLVDPDTPCSPAGYPAYVVNATTATDVKLGLKFGRLSEKNSLDSRNFVADALKTKQRASTTCESL
jgi:hypothetical protein